MAAFELEGSHFWGHADAGRPAPPPRAARANDCIRPALFYSLPLPVPGPARPPSLIIPHPQGVFSQHRPGPALPRAARPHSPPTLFSQQPSHLSPLVVHSPNLISSPTAIGLASISLFFFFVVLNGHLYLFEWSVVTVGHPLLKGQGQGGLVGREPNP